MEDRKDKIASVRERIEALIASPVQPDGGDEWPTPTPEQVNEFRELVYDLANLAFEPDYKERSVLDIIICSKKEGKLHTFYEPRDVDLYQELKLSEDEFMRYFAEVTRTATHMISTGQSMLDRFSNVASYRAQKMEEDAERKADFDRARQLLDEGKLDAFRDEADRLMEKFDPPRYAGTGEAAKRPYNRNGNHRSLPEELQAMIDDYGIELKSAGRTEEIDAGIAELTPLLDAAEPLVGVDHRTNGGYEGSFDEAISQVREVLNKYRYRVGVRALQPVVIRYNRLSNEHRAIVTLRQRGLKVTLEQEAA